MRLGDLPRHPHYSMLLSAMQTLLDNHRDVVVAKAGSADERAMRVAAGKCSAIKEVLDQLQDAKRKTEE